METIGFEERSLDREKVEYILSLSRELYFLLRCWLNCVCTFQMAQLPRCVQGVGRGERITPCAMREKKSWRIPGLYCLPLVYFIYGNGKTQFVLV